MLRIGLTGGIGSGKSTVTALFRELGAPIIDADQIARQVVQPGSRALQAIVDHFGPQLLRADHTLDRHALKLAIFNNDAEKTWLETLLHPLIRAEMTTALSSLQVPYVILDIPLLIETLPNPLVDRICVIDLPPALQIERVVQRDNLTPETVALIISKQATREQRLAHADDIITNNASLDILKQQVIALDKAWRML